MLILPFEDNLLVVASYHHLNNNNNRKLALNEMYHVLLKFGNASN